VDIIQLHKFADLFKAAVKEVKIETNFDKGDHVFGYQLLLDFYNCKKGVCDDMELCYDFLDKVVEHIGMNRMAPPQILRGDAKKYPEKGPGLSGWIPLIESSAVIHTLSKKDFISIDVYSCKYFEVQKTLDFARQYFKPKVIEYQTIERGIDYYRVHTKHHSMTASDDIIDIEKK
jgi:S-adenosylmethionine decarboxylase